jgi:TolB-like protein/DNA-binding winged helix-turn-helix (wHTH) protein
MPMPSQKILRFGGFTLDPNTAGLFCEDRQLQLRPKSFDVLLYLARHPGRVASKDELIETVWSNIFVTDNSLVQCISDIRVALDDEGQTILKTVARRGYLFAATVTEVEPGSAQPDMVAAAPPISTSDPPQAGAMLPRARAALLLAALACVAGAAGATSWWWRTGSVVDALPSAASGPASALEQASNSRRISIAVLPLVTIGAPPGDDYFVDGLTEDITSALARFSELSVLSPRTAFPYKGKTYKPEDIGRELKVGYLAEGSVRRTPERIRITIRLTDAARGTLLWADQYDAEPDGIFAIQDNITRQITGALAVRLSNAEQARAAAKPPGSLEAYDLVLRGRDLLSRLSRATASNARVMFERAIELAPDYGPAYVGLGRVDLTAVALGWTPDPAGALQRAQGLARTAIGSDEFNPAAHVLLGRTYARLGEYDRALDALRRAMTMNPSDPDCYAGLGDALLWSGDVEPAIKALESAVQLDPKLSTEDLFNLGTAYFLAGQHAAAIRTFERTVTRNDSTIYIHAMLAAVQAEAGHPDDAARSLAEVRRRNPFFDAAGFGSLFRNPQHRQRIIAALQMAGL